MRLRAIAGLSAALTGQALTGHAAAQPLRGTIEQRTFLNPATQQTVPFNIYLPEGYAGSGQRYPVVYHLHGLGGSQGGPHNTSVPASFEAALVLNLIGPVIVVFPHGYTDAWWADSFSATKPAETDVLRLIEHVDATVRTIATRGARVVQGFSMGGFGATKFYSKHPTLFTACVEYDGALVTWSTMQQSHAALAAEIFGNNAAYFDQYSPWHWTGVNAPTLAAGHPVRMVVGSLVVRNRQFRDHLIGLTIPVDYVETTCGHDLGCLLSAQGLNTAAFIGSRLELGCQACYPDCDCSGAPLNVNDFTCFLNKYAAGDSYANCDGSTTAPILNVSDFSCFLNRYAAGCP